MAERAHLYRFFSLVAGAGLPLLVAGYMLSDRWQYRNFPPSIEIGLNSERSLHLYDDGIVLSETKPCSSIPIDSGKGEFLSGGTFIGKRILLARNPSIQAFGQNDISGCDRPWVLDRQRRQSVQ